MNKPGCELVYSDINEVENGWMAQLLYKIKILYEYVQKERLNGAFTDELEKCLELTFNKNIVRDGGEKQTVWVLKDSCTALGGHELVVRDVQRNLKKAYDALHTGDGRRLSYEKYERFMEVCRGWGSFMGDRQMMSWYQETLEEYMTGGRKQPGRPAGEAAEPTNAGTKTDGVDRMQELLAALRKLLETYE